MKISNFKFQIILITLLLVFGIVNTAHAEEAGSPSAQATESSKTNYQLAYPGLLPDHPLYFLKAGRDRIMSFFISKPLKKAEFNLLQADKRVESAQMLIKKGDSKIELSKNTFSKAENYFENAIDNTSAAKSQGINTSGFAQKLYDSNQRHQQILKDMTKKQNGKNKNKFALEHERLKQFGKKVKELNQKQ